MLGALTAAILGIVTLYLLADFGLWFTGKLMPFGGGDDLSYFIFWMLLDIVIMWRRPDLPIRVLWRRIKVWPDHSE